MGRLADIFRTDGAQAAPTAAWRRAPEFTSIRGMTAYLARAGRGSGAGSPVFVKLSCPLAKLMQGGGSGFDSLGALFAAIPEGVQAAVDLSGCTGREIAGNPGDAEAEPAWFARREAKNRLVRAALPDSISAIGAYAFSGCTALSDIVIPPRVADIGGSAFLACISLERAALPERLTSLGRYAFYGCVSLEEVSVPAGVTVLENGVFADCAGLKSVSIAGRVTSIGAGAFEGCLSLERLALPATVAHIGDWAFSYCVSLPAVTIPAGVRDIGLGAFLGCSEVSRTAIPAAAEIGRSAFRSCARLSRVKFEGNGTAFYYDEPKESANSFPHAARLREAYSAGGAGTYVYTGETWVRE